MSHYDPRDPTSPIPDLMPDSMTTRQYDRVMDLNTLCGRYGCLPGQHHVRWLEQQLNELAHLRRKEVPPR